MDYIECLPHTDLSPFIRCYWRLSAAPSSFGGPFRFLNEGMELAVSLADSDELGKSGPCGREVWASVVSGPMTRPMRFAPAGAVEMIGVCFRAGGAYPFVRVPAWELTDVAAEVADLWTIGRLDGFFEGFGPNGCGFHERISRLDRLFLSMLEKRSQEDDVMASVLRTIESKGGNIRIGALARSVGMSRRQLERKFKERVGMAPKQLCKNLRFKQMMVRLPQIGKASWADTALACGYYDQSHMINDFKHFTGTSPAAYVAGDSVSERVLFSRL